MKKKYYLAYGSNLNIRQMLFRCPNARIVGTTTLQGWQLMFKGSQTGSYLTIEKRKGSTVPVGVWEITESDEKSLDRYEGYPNFYYKRVMNITYKGIKTGKERSVRAMVYIMHEERPLGLPTYSYVGTCAEGYQDFDFDIKTLTEAIQFSKEGMKK